MYKFFNVVNVDILNYIVDLYYGATNVEISIRVVYPQFGECCYLLLMIRYQVKPAQTFLDKTK